MGEIRREFCISLFVSFSPPARTPNRQLLTDSNHEGSLMESRVPAAVGAELVASAKLYAVMAVKIHPVSDDRFPAAVGADSV